jgi:hypothetical protein
LTKHSYSGTVTFSDPNAANSPQLVTVYLRVLGGETEPPFGVFETPLDGTTGIEGSVAITGWVLDDVGVVSVKIYRDLMEGEPGGENGRFWIGDAVFVEGARPDVEQAYPTYPMNYRAGWGYMMLTNFLPNGGNGSYRIHAIATDREGKRTLLGSRTINCNNANAVLPFGAIDTPAQGGTASGNAYVNFGWALTPIPKSIPTDGSTIWVWIDGVPVGHPVYNNYRVDIATLFPGYANSDGAVGYFYIDTTAYPNGVHTIAWSAVDSAGVGNGFGSRYFTIQNIGASVQGERSGIETSQAGRFQKTAELEGIVLDSRLPILVGKGFDREALSEEFYPDDKGLLRVEILELERVEINLTEKNESAIWQGYLKVGDELRELPIGTTFDASTGILYWQPGPGFIGDYEFVFLSRNANSRSLRTSVMVTIKPKM